MISGEYDNQRFSIDATNFDRRLPSPGVDTVSESFSGSCSLGKRKSGRFDGYIESTPPYYLDISKRGRSGSKSYTEARTHNNYSIGDRYNSARGTSSGHINEGNGGNEYLFVTASGAEDEHAGAHYVRQSEQNVNSRLQNRRRRRSNRKVRASFCKKGV